MKKDFLGKHASFWMDSAADSGRPAFSGEMEADVAVVGGGIAGLLSALEMAEAGKRVVVLEADRLIGGVTARTTAHISYGHNLVYSALKKNMSGETAGLYAKANQAGLEKIAGLIERHRIDCDFKRLPQYIYAEDEKNVAALKDEYMTVQAIGLPVSYAPSAPVPFPTYGAIEYKNVAQFHPRKFLFHIARLIEEKGGLIYEKTRVSDVKEGESCVVQTPRGEVRARDVIIATHFPILDRGMYFARMRVERSYVLGFYAEDKLPENLYESVEDPSYYIRTQETPRGQLIILGGADHETGKITDTRERYRRLEAYARKRFKIKSIEYHWSTQDNYPFDDIPFIGRYTVRSHNLYVATGFKGWGMTHAAVAADIMGGLILGREGQGWEKIFEPGRLKLGATYKDLAKKNMEVVRHFTSQRLKDDKTPLEKLEKGEGIITRLGGEDAAVYRDEQGIIHAHSAKCSHMGCHVSWNGAEKSWDCPCHGSRFDAKGRVIHSPATKDLKKIDLADD